MSIFAETQRGRGTVESVKFDTDPFPFDEFKDYPESALYMIGAIDETKEKVKSGAPVATATPV